MELTSKLKLDSSVLLVFILTAGVFGIINTEMGVICLWFPVVLNDKCRVCVIENQKGIL